MQQNNFKSKLLIAVVVFLITIVSIAIGFIALRFYSSKSFVLNASIENLNKERSSAVLSKTVFLDNEEFINILNFHTINNENQIPEIVTNLENYAESIGASITINTINLEEEKKSAASEDKEKPSPSRKLKIEAVANGDFNDLLNLIKLFENGDYVLNIDEYSIRQVVVLPASKPGSGPSFRDVSPNDDSINLPNKTWYLDIKMSASTNIK